MAKFDFTPDEKSETKDGFVHGTIVVTFDNPKYEKPEEGAFTLEPEQHKFEQVVTLPKDFKQKAQEYADDYEKSFNEQQEN